MPKLKNSTIFCNRGFVILMLEDFDKTTAHSSFRVLPTAKIIESFKKVSDKINFDIKRCPCEKTLTNGRPTGLTQRYLNVINAVSSAKRPTIIETSSALFDDSTSSDDVMFQTYIRMLVYSTGGFIVNCAKRPKGSHLLETNQVFPVVNYDVIGDSWTDVEPKFDNYLVKRVLSDDYVEYYNTMHMLSGLSTSSIGFCLGDISRMWVDFPNEETSLKTIINVNGPTNVPISVDEFSAKIWSNADIPSFSPEQTLITRSPNATSQLVLNYLLTKKEFINKKLEIYNV